MVYIYVLFVCFFFFKQKTAYEMRISDWSSDVCSSDLFAQVAVEIIARIDRQGRIVDRGAIRNNHQDAALLGPADQALMRPQQGLAIDILFQQPLAQHQPEVADRKSVV